MLVSQTTKLPDYQIAKSLYDLGCQRNNLQKLLLTQLTRDRSENARSYRLSSFVDQHCRILIEADISSVTAPVFLTRAHDDSLNNLALLHLAFGGRFLHGRSDHVAQPGVQSRRTAQRQ